MPDAGTDARGPGSPSPAWPARLRRYRVWPRPPAASLRRRSRSGDKYSRFLSDHLHRGRARHTGTFEIADGGAAKVVQQPPRHRRPCRPISSRRRRSRRRPSAAGGRTAGRTACCREVTSRCGCSAPREPGKADGRRVPSVGGRSACRAAVAVQHRPRSGTGIVTTTEETEWRRDRSLSRDARNVARRAGC